MTADDFRDLALALAGVVEQAHMGHPDFRVNGRIFASLQADERTASLKLMPDEQRAFMRDHPGVFEPAAGAWGRQGWTRIQLKPATIGGVRPALLLAWEHIVQAPAPRKKVAAAPRTTRRPSGGRRTAQTLADRASQAKTPADHAKVAKSYRLQAEAFDAKAAEHEARAAALAKHQPGIAYKWPAMAPPDITTAKQQAMEARRAARESRELAEHHLRLSVEALAND